MAITLASNFDETAAVPLDSRYYKADTTARDAIPSGVRFQGLQVFTLADETLWVLKTGLTNSDWVEAGSGSTRTSTTFTGTSVTPTTAMDETFAYNAGSSQSFSTTGFGTIASLVNGYRATIMGTSDTNLLTIADSNITDGRIMNGDAVLGLGMAITFEYNSTLARMVEISRNF